ncbi:MAG: hypothetical protein EWV82_13790 [Microcystis aeruginosa Ma_AC_P_19900807_S299]|nr:MAG: hypothetical protein EWV82_13790 [Microcystis aeruginosa Ma_AC_P_19900807_S299]
MKTAKYPEKIAALWTTFLLGTLFHTQLGLMPLFHGQSIVESHQTSNLDPIFWGMLLFFLLPMLAIIGVNFSESRSLRKSHFWLTILLVRPIAWYQIALMAILLIIGLILNLVSYQWLRLAIAHPRDFSESH